MTRRRTAALILFVAAAAALTMIPAGAQSQGTPETFGASASSTALSLVVFGNGLTLGHAESSLASDPKASSRGVGAILPDATPVTDNVAAVDADGQTTGSPDQTCGPITLPADVPALDLATACSSAVASISSGLPAASATGVVGTLGVGTGDVIGGTPLGDAVDEVNDALGGLLGDAPLPVDSLVSDLLDALTSDGNLVSVTLGPSSADSTAAVQSVTTAGTAQGAVIELIQRIALPPMVTIEIGAATATATLDRATSKATGEFDPALVRVTLADDVATALGLPPEANPIEIAPGQSQCLPLPDPLTSCITVGSGEVTPTDTGITATAAGVSLDLLTGLPEGGVGLDLAVASASVNGTPAQAPETTTTTSAPELARTGAGTPWAPLAGLGFLAMALLALGATRLAAAGEARR